ncbi:adenosylcobinamide-phosphate synthase CbiB [Nocardioides rotundus]|uniref:adenosylcobinamide-phosphate synthase CbiB n=1 Tax=Nocardioides rotundus TaxID=1774216 RepID=UPI001CBE7AEE|nr:adenosylcobinamide-phosphate synthase CbiB [Nocardioides rotundus]UAL30059.1 adenosylcobinamide-phosphate synthase CbiB [Nocardioides rotundus]
MTTVLRDRAALVAAGLLLDRALGEPPARLHPVALFGRGMTAVEARLWADDRARGVGYAALGVAAGALAGRVLGRVPGGLALAVAVAVAGRMLRETASEVERPLLTGDLAGARAALPALVGRDPSELDESGISAAVVESLAENSVDAVIAPACWALVAGAPGDLAHRAVNTMDAMVGHRSARYERFGWAAARLDDVANWVPARVFAALVALVRPGRAARVRALVHRDAKAHPSPNAGVAETAVAAALGRQLGGTLRYGDRVEERPLLGEGPRPTPADVARARRLVDDVERAAVALLLLAALAGRRTPWRSR